MIFASTKMPRVLTHFGRPPYRRGPASLGGLEYEAFSRLYRDVSGTWDSERGEHVSGSALTSARTHILLVTGHHGGAERGECTRNTDSGQRRPVHRNISYSSARKRQRTAKFLNRHLTQKRPNCRVNTETSWASQRPGV